MRMLTAMLVLVPALSCMVEISYDGTAYQCPDGVSCPPGFVCVAGICRSETRDAAPVDGAPDALIDAPLFDARAFDAFSADAEIDATQLDAQCFHVVELRVGASSDDAEESEDGLVVSLTDDDLELTWDNTPGNQTVGIRWTLAVPQGATISTAHVQFTTDATPYNDWGWKEIRGQASNDAATFSDSANNVSGRPTTTNYVSWTPLDWETPGEAGANQRTPELKDVVQEVVDRPGWLVDNGFALIIIGEDLSRREAYSWDGDAADGSGAIDKAPLLHVEYYDAGCAPD